jgi:hypothetical protein
MRALLIAAFLSGSAAADPLDKMSWLAGRWLSADGAAEETWTPLVGDGMAGHFRLVKNGSVVFYELLAIQREGAAVFMRMRHFDRQLAPSEKDAMVYRLASADDKQAVFTHDTDKVRRIVYRVEDGGLRISLERSDGKSDDFRFRRAP